MDVSELVGVPAAVTSTAIGAPQFVRLWVHRDASGVSTWTWWLTACAGATWVAHNVRHGEWAAVVANGWSALTALAILYKCYAEGDRRLAGWGFIVPVAVGGVDAVVAVGAPDRLGWVAAAVGLVQFVPQAVGVLTSRDVAGVSVWSWWLAVVASLLWGTYGVLHDDPAIVVPPVVTGALAVVIVFRLAVLRWRRHGGGLGTAGDRLPVGDGAIRGAVDR